MRLGLDQRGALQQRIQVRRLGRLQRLGQQLVEVVQLDAQVLAQHAGEPVVLHLGMAGIQEIVEEEMIARVRRHAHQFATGTVDHYFAQGIDFRKDVDVRH